MKTNRRVSWLPVWAAVVMLAASACGTTSIDEPTIETTGRDPHSFARADEVAVRHLDLDVAVNFDERIIEGTATLELDRQGDADELWLDTRDLDIRGVRLQPGDVEADHRLGDEVDFLGRPLTVDLRPDTTAVSIEYASRPGAIALQWLEPHHTAGGRHPFLLTQSQSVFARTWIPCQDSPGLRMTYDATVRVPPGLLALMSAENPTEPTDDGVYSFRMRQPIPAYLLALAVGDVSFREIGPRTGVYAEPEVLESAAWEFADTERMLEAAERLYGPYRWERFDVIVLPPSFPYGGMENPRLTFLTPTLLAGDRSLVATIAHELAHSWSGNLVTNADWNDFWLNEGFTSYFEKRIMEVIYGTERAATQAVIDLETLLEEMQGLSDADTHLRLELAGADPESGLTYIPYEKGSLFLSLLEQTVGRESWDAFLAEYFDEHAFGSMTTERFLEYLRERLIARSPDPEALEERLRIDDWVYGPGLPDNRPEVLSDTLDQVEGQVQAWVGGRPVDSLDTGSWTALERLHFVREIPATVPAARLAELDGAFGLTGAQNAEIHQAWLLLAIRTGYEPAREALESFLMTVGRLKFLGPLYGALAATPDGREEARRIYREARPGYHPITTATLDGILGWPGDR